MKFLKSATLIGFLLAGGSISLTAAFVSPTATAATADSLSARREELNSLILEQWEDRLRRDPELASDLGDLRYNDRWRDFSQAGLDAENQQDREFLKRFKALNNQGFSVEEKLNQALMVRQLSEKVAAARFKKWQMPMIQNSGDHLEVPGIVPRLSFATVKDYDDYIARLRRVPALFEQNTVQMRNGLKNGQMPPQFLLEKVVRQCENIGAMSLASSPFMLPLQKIPADFSEAEQQRLRTEIEDALRLHVVPAYQKLAKFMREEYAPHGRQKPGIWALPGGDARYKFLVKSFTTTDLTPEAIHQLGLREVRRIEGQMLAVAKKQGYTDLKSFNAFLAKNPDVYPKSGQQMLDLYVKYTEQMYAKLPQLFGRLPKGKVKIMQVESFREKEAAAASYQQGTPDGSRPGHVMVNIGDFEKRMTLSIESTALHEGVPGHHMQIAIAQELEGLPAFRQQGNYTVFSEGWALYSERLGEELGFFQDPLSFYGHLQDEMLRAIRLVVDTGLHYKKWNRQQVVDFFHAHSGIEEVDVQSETDRYIANPGQALSYKIGQLKILELRRYASARLGKKFDIRGFHDEVLGAGALPLDLLEKRIYAWVARQ
jgi:uncharacterized protein (DUF885 family)